ncbi:hypothetical protein BDB01DRAFT_853132 [Pilobolus umbonatus]|nr:hypothetical protein BDB01DRAFT_853132 [Pilobolus umbonatus]
MVPAEIIEAILKHLDHKGLYACLTVNTYFYSICIKYLYKEIYLANGIDLGFLLTCINLYPRSREAAKYVCLLSVRGYAITNDIPIRSNIPINHSITKSLTIQLNKYIDFIDSLVYLPNIKHLLLNPTSDFIQQLIDNTKPILTKLEKFSVYYYGGNNLADCYYKYRSSMTTLNMHNNTLYFGSFTYERLVSHIASYPCLQQLVINVARVSLRSHLSFADILRACPALVYLRYIAKSMNLRPLDHVETQEFSLKKLRLEVCHITFEDAQYIRDSLTQLKILNLNVKTNIEERGDIVSTVLEIQSLISVQYTFPSFSSIKSAAEIYHVLTNRSKQRNESMINKAKFYVHKKYKPPLLYTTYHPEEHRRSVNISVDLNKNPSWMFPVLNNMGIYLNKLDINGSNTAIDLECIRRRCPVLSYLVLQNLSIIPRVRKLTVNNCLTNLTINSCSIKVSALKELTECYPKLKHLCFSDINIMGDDKNEIHYFHLNITSLKIKPSLFSGPVWGMMVMKAVDDVWVKSWLYNGGQQQEIIAEDIQATSIKPIVDSPLYVFISNNVEDFSIH